jgi:dihydroflavonol-4-reductase
MQVLVTGADGLLGSNMVRLLLAAGHQVGVLIQSGRDPFTLEGLDIERYQGDILDYPSVAAAIRGKEAVIHAAASTAVWPSRSPLVRRVNIEGTENMIRAAEAGQVDRFVYIGTANSFTPGPIEAPGDESGPYGCEHYGLDYMDSKYRAQQLVLEAAGRGLPALTVNPTFMIGPYDATPSSGTMLIRLAQGRVPGYTGGGKCWCHVNDVATAAVNALTMGRPGESYIAGNRNLDYGEFFRLAAEIIGVDPPRRLLPAPFVLAGGAAGSLVSSFTGRQPLLSYPMARIACDGHYYKPEKARKELAMPASSLEDAVEESFSWLKDNGYLERI